MELSCLTSVVQGDRLCLEITLSVRLCSTSFCLLVVVLTCFLRRLWHLELLSLEAPSSA